ncbi:Crp/Fnr family transcriptional regulator [Chitinophaga silvatica]|uniref:Crp/Fnr family transcriptional regulator n=1 Tax=Chitinophaga silvatica TaxID=2282649 RepID=A0A3E1YGV4_9BACT|nr:Crp/Fnr family transcriptional regulator [Chitinophaga silvatica]RFS26597.1 Crp/Fnr family transcriptional regulator [Chitinophaga silvatica]
MKKNSKCDLQTCFLCRESISEWKPAIAEHRQHIQIKKNALIFNEGDPVTGIYFLYSGKVKVHKPWGTDKELILRFAQKGDIIGHRGLTSTQKIYTVSATALEDTEVCFVPLSFFEASLKVNPALSVKLMEFFADELQKVEQKMNSLVHQEVKGRIAAAILELSQLSQLQPFAISRQDLASYAGTTYETVYRNLQEFIQEKLITVDGKIIQVLQEKKLKKIALI